MYYASLLQLDFWIIQDVFRRFHVIGFHIFSLDVLFSLGFSRSSRLSNAEPERGRARLRDHTFHNTTSIDPSRNPSIGATICNQSGSFELLPECEETELVAGISDKLPRVFLKASRDEFGFVRGSKPSFGGRFWMPT
jgi:hypothetical protein